MLKAGNHQANPRLPRIIKRAADNYEPSIKQLAISLAQAFNAMPDTRILMKSPAAMQQAVVLKEALRLLGGALEKSPKLLIAITSNQRAKLLDFGYAFTSFVI